MAYKVLDLFSGAGGLSRGFYDAGYDVVLGVDFDEAALKTFKANHGKAEAMKLDLFDHSNIDVIINFLKDKDIKLDVLVGGPPCQGFSVAGPRDMNDKRNTLYTAMVELAERVKLRLLYWKMFRGWYKLMEGLVPNVLLKTLLRLVIEWCQNYYMHQIMDSHRYGREYFLLVLGIQIKTLFSHLRQ